MPLHRTWPLAVLLAASCDAPEGDLALFDSTGAALPTAGRLTVTSTPSRQMQLSLRWAF